MPKHKARNYGFLGGAWDDEQRWKEIQAACLVPEVRTLQEFDSRIEQYWADAYAALEDLTGISEDLPGIITSLEDLQRLQILRFGNLFDWAGKLGLEQITRIEALQLFPYGNSELVHLLLYHAGKKLTGFQENFLIDPTEYDFALKVARTGNLGPLSRVLHRAFWGWGVRRHHLYEPSAYIPSPYHVVPQNGIRPIDQALEKSRRESPKMIRAKQPPLERDWLGGFGLEDLIESKALSYTRGRHFEAAQTVMQSFQGKPISAGEAIKAIEKIQSLEPYIFNYTILGFLLKKVRHNEELKQFYLNFALKVLEPALLAMTSESQHRLALACRKILERNVSRRGLGYALRRVFDRFVFGRGSIPSTVESINTLYNRAQYQNGPSMPKLLSQSQGQKLPKSPKHTRRRN